ncbi:hypothetical protein Tco_0180778 [Tanacetum coccineum]
MSITTSNKPRLFEPENSTLPNHDTDKVPSDESERNTTDPSVAISASSVIDYDSADEFSVCITPLPPLEKLAGVEPVFGPKTIKSTLKSNSTSKAEILKSVIINEPSSAPAKGNISISVSKTNSAPAGTSASHWPRHYGYNDHQSDDCLYSPTCELYGSYDHDTHVHNRIISLKRGIKPRNPQHVTKNCETCGSNFHTTTDHNDIEWFRKRKAPQAKKAETLKTSKSESSRSKTPTKRLWDETTFKRLIVELRYDDTDTKPEPLVVTEENCRVTRPCFETIGYREKVPIKGTLKKSILPLRWRLLTAQTIQCLGSKTRGFDQIFSKDAIILYCLANGVNIDYATAKLVVFKAPKPSLNAERVPQGTKPRAQPRHKKHSTYSKQPSVSSHEATKVVAEMHKDDQQATGGPTSLGVTSEERADPQLSYGMSAFNLNDPIFSTSFIIHSEYTLGNNALAVSTAEADPRKSAPSDFVPQQQGMNEGTKNTSYDHLSSGTDPHVLPDKTQYVSEGLETVLTQPVKGKEASSIAIQVKEDKASRMIKLEDLTKLVSSVQPSFKDLDSPEDDHIIVVGDSDKDEEANKVHATTNSQNHKLELEKNKAEAALLRAQPSFPNMGQLNELLVKSLQTEFSNILSAHDFSSSLPTKLKELPSKFNELTKEVKGLKKQVQTLEIKLPRELKEIPTKLEDFTKTVTSLTSQVAELKTLLWELLTEFLLLPKQVKVIQAKLKILDALLSLLHKVTNALNHPPKSSSQPEGEHIKKDKGKKALSSEKGEKESTNINFDDDETHVTGSMVESSRIKKVKKFDFVTEDGKHIHLTEEQINQQKKIEDEAKAEAAKHESEVRKEELVDLLGPEVVNKYYNDKL